MNQLKVLLKHTTQNIFKGISVILLGCVDCYQKLWSQFSPPACRYLPSCSGYAKEAIKLHGPLQGLVLSIVRVMKCHPFAKPKYDPVPKKLNNILIKGSLK